MHQCLTAISVTEQALAIVLRAAARFSLGKLFTHSVSVMDETIDTFRISCQDTKWFVAVDDTPRIISPMEWYEAAKKRMRELGITQEDLIKPLGVQTRGAVGHYLTGRRTPTPEQFKELASMLKLNMNQLIESSLESNVEPGPGVMHSRSRAIPIVGRAMLGESGYFIEENHPVGHGDGWIDAPTTDPNAYALRMVGLSMTPAIKHNWIVTCEPNAPPVAGEYVHVMTRDGKHMVKEYLFERDGAVSLLSVNGGHRFSIPLAEIEYIHYVGGVFPPSKRRL